MSKRPSDPSHPVVVANQAALDRASGAITEIDFGYTPDLEEQLLKAKFWLLYNEMPNTERAQIGPASITQLTGDTRISKWWRKPEFKSWFINDRESDYISETGYALAQKFYLSILLDPEASFTQKEKAAKAFKEDKFKRKENSAQSPWKDLDKLSEDELDATIQSLQGLKGR